MRFFCFIFVCLFGCVERCNPEMLFFWPIIIVVFNIQTCACFTGFVPSYFIFFVSISNDNFGHFKGAGFQCLSNSL